MRKSSKCWWVQRASPTGGTPHWAPRRELPQPFCAGVICPVKTEAPSLIINPFRIQFHPLSSCAYYAPIGRQKWTIVSTLEEFTIYWKQMFSSLETWDVLEFQSTEALPEKKLKRDYLYGLVSLTWSTVQLRRAVCLRSVKDDLGCPGSLPYTVAMNLKFWNQKFF